MGGVVVGESVDEDDDAIVKVIIVNKGPLLMVCASATM